MILVVVLLAISAFVHVLMLIPAGMIFILAIIVFGAKTGLQIDTNLMQYRSYGKIGGYVFGNWTPFINIESAILRHTSENVYKPGMATASLSGRSQSTIVTTFDIVFVNSNNKEKTIFEFSEYKLAIKALRLIKDQMEINVVNKVAEKMAENKRSRR